MPEEIFFFPSRKRKEGEENGRKEACVPVVSPCERAVLGAPERSLRQAVRAESEVQLTGETSRDIQSTIGLPGRRVTGRTNGEG